MVFVVVTFKKVVHWIVFIRNWSILYNSLIILILHNINCFWIPSYQNFLLSTCCHFRQMYHWTNFLKKSWPKKFIISHKWVDEMWWRVDYRNTHKFLFFQIPINTLALVLLMMHIKWYHQKLKIAFLLYLKKLVVVIQTTITNIVYWFASIDWRINCFD